MAVPLVVFLLSFLLRTITSQEVTPPTSVLRPPAPSAPIDESEVTFAILRDGDKHIQLGRATDLIVVLGVSGSGKSTLVKFVAGDNHNLFGRRKGFDFIYEDGDKKIGNAPINSMTLYPELTLDRETGAAFVDCPGFFDTRNTSLDIAGGYFIKKVFDQAKTVKILFTLAHGSVRSGYERRGFTDMLTYAATILTDLDKYQDSVGLMLTKVDNYPPMPDAEIIQYAKDFMREAKSNLQERVVEGEKIKLNNNMIRLIDIFLDDSNGEKIALFRRPDKEGPVSDSEFLQNNKKDIRKVILNHLQYVKTASSDFGYTISSESKLYIRDMLLDMVDMKIQHFFKVIGKDLHLTYATLGRHSRDLLHFKTLIQNDYTTLSIFKRDNITADEVPILLATCFNVIKTSVYGESKVKEIMGYLTQSKAFRTFLSDKNNQYIQKWTEPIFVFYDYLERLKLWYTVLEDVQNNLKTTEVILKSKEYSKNLAKTIVTSENINKILANLQDIPSLKENVNIKTLVNQPVNTEEFVFRDLTKLLNGSLAVNYNCIGAKHFDIFGRYLVVSDVLAYANECGSSLKSITINAYERIFIDVDVKAVGKELQLTIISPRWEIIGNRKIVLDGVSGSSVSPSKARSGTNIGERGTNGQAGNSGQPSGTFLGVGLEFIRGEHLKISAVGGSGSNGQDGGDGANGRNGVIPHLPGAGSVGELQNNLAARGYTFTRSDSRGGDHAIVWDDSREYNEYVVTGAQGASGADGGHGGQGGRGAKGGDIKIIEMEGASNIKTVSQDGSSGPAGNGGRGGSAGSPTGTMRIKCQKRRRRIIGIKIKESFNCWEEGGRSQQNFNGGSSGNAGQTPSKKPEEVQYIKISDKIVGFKKHVRENIVFNSIDISSTQKSLMQIDTNTMILSTMQPLNILQDIKEIELLYMRYKDRSDFKVFYQSELAGIMSYARNAAELPDQTQKVLYYAVSCVLSKLYEIESGTNRFLLIDIKTYINSALENIQQLRETGRNMVISDIRSNYEGAIDKTIREVEILIQEHNNVEVAALGRDIDKNIEELLNENLALQKDAKQHQTELIVADKKIHDQLEEKGLQSIFKTFSSVLSLFNPISTAISAFTGSFGELGSSLLGAATKNIDQFVSPIISKVQGAQDTIKNFIKKGSRNINSFILFLDVISEKTGLFPEQSKQIINTIKKVKNDFLKPISNFDLAGKINGYKNSILSDIKDVVGQLNTNGSSSIEMKNFTDFLTAAQNLVPVSDSLGDYFSEHREEYDKISEISRAFTANYKELKRLNDMEYQIYSKMLPTLQEIYKDLEKAVTDLSGKRLPVLDISQWCIQKTLRDSNLNFRSFLENSKLEGKFMRGSLSLRKVQH